MLTTLDGLPVRPNENAPSAGHSISTASTPTTAHKGRTSPEGVLSPSTRTAYQRFVARQRVRDHVLKKATCQEQMAERVMRRLDSLEAFLSDDEVWFAKLEEAKLRDLVLAEGVLIDKLQILQGKATQVISLQQQEKIDQIAPALMQLIQQRGLHVTATERTVQVET